MSKEHKKKTIKPRFERELRRSRRKGIFRTSGTSEPWWSPGPTPIIRFSEKAAADVVKLVEGDPKRECGCFLIGNLLTDRITGATVAFVDEVFSDWQYGGAADYTFSNEVQVNCTLHVMREFKDTKHVIGTLHSHGTFPAFFSSVDYKMMNSRRSQEFHLVVSPSRHTYTVTYKDLDYGYHHDAELLTENIGNIFTYERVIVHDKVQ